MEPLWTALSVFTMASPILLNNWESLVQTQKTIRGFMGPPLETSFASCLPANQIETAIQLYRSYYKEKGVYEAQLFPQIKELLTELAQQYPLYITTTKNTPTAVHMTANFEIDHFL